MQGARNIAFCLKRLPKSKGAGGALAAPAAPLANFPLGERVRRGLYHRGRRRASRPTAVRGGIFTVGRVSLLQEA